MRYPCYFILLLFGSCSYQPDQTDGSGLANSFTDPQRKKIAEWQDRRQTDSLIIAIETMPKYKAATALALASVQDSSAITALSRLLSDQDPIVRLNAAYALGQSYDTAAIDALFQRLPNEGDTAVKASLLEALGKTITASQLNELVNFTPSNAEESVGYLWGLYRAGIRNIFNRNSTRAVVGFLDTASLTETRLAAAHYLSQVPFTAVPYFGYEILNKEYADAGVRMAIAATFNKTPPLVAINGLRPLFKDEDYRVRINAVRAIPERRISTYTSFIDTLLTDANVNAAIAAASKIVSATDYLVSESIDQWLQKKSLNWRVKALLLKAAIKKDPGADSRIEQVKKAFQSTYNPYEKAALLGALSYTFRAHQFLVTETFKATHPAVSTAGIKALAELRSIEGFPEALKPTLKDVFIMAIESGDVAMMDIAAAVLRNPQLDFKSEIKDLAFLHNALQRLRLPKDNETLQSLEKALAYFEDRPPKEIRNDFNHPIQWEKLTSLKGRQEAVIQTSKGDIIIILFTNEAPGSVLNFVELAQSGYYDNKVFHRVVPNFVVQGGGNRGDGWGSENYSIRSEFPYLRFTTGTVGMASAGKDTEGTQWFFTHSPTPHLEGRYTIFARVKNGMDVVHRLEQGDIINSVKIN